ncbi:DUF488 domain-containing protein [Nocardioides sp. NPDC000445]|uniref:DUF488 domain-containing protein n=1 Tax=Nocardioides sp. NPDC000445 TaxID=3154257 RepID=UPI0033189FA9
MDNDGTIFTIGHSTLEADVFVALLQRHGISAVADVRSVPASRFNPQFNRDALKATLAKSGIEYVSMGRELGARSEDPNCYVNGKVQYGRLAQAPPYQAGLERLASGRQKHRIAIMCSEGDPLDCHRAILVAESLVSLAIPVIHILGDGMLEPHNETRLRLRLLHGLAEADLFNTLDELTKQALHRQEIKIAYVDDGNEEVAD